jgi:hypothetical protein
MTHKNYKYRALHFTALSMARSPPFALPVLPQVVWRKKKKMARNGQQCRSIQS